MIKYILTAKSTNNQEMVAAHDEVFDSLMVIRKGCQMEEYILFDNVEDAEGSISAYQSFQRELINFNVEKIDAL